MCSAFTKELPVIKIRVDQTKTSKKRTQCALDTTFRKQAQITLIRHEPSFKQLEVKNEPTIVCMRKSQRHLV
jgi:hypothetical protein